MKGEEKVTVLWERHQEMKLLQRSNEVDRMGRAFLGKRNKKNPKKNMPLNKHNKLRKNSNIGFFLCHSPLTNVKG